MNWFVCMMLAVLAAIAHIQCQEPPDHRLATLDMRLSQCQLADYTNCSASRADSLFQFLREYKHAGRVSHEKAFNDAYKKISLMRVSLIAFEIVQTRNGDTFAPALFWRALMDANHAGNTSDTIVRNIVYLANENGVRRTAVYRTLNAVLNDKRDTSPFFDILYTATMVLPQAYSAE